MLQFFKSTVWLNLDKLFKHKEEIHKILRKIIIINPYDVKTRR